MSHPLFLEAPLKEEVPCPTFQKKRKTNSLWLLLGVSQVVESKNGDWKVGDVFEANGTKWQDYNVLDTAALARARRLDQNSGLPLSTALGVLGMPGTDFFFLFSFSGHDRINFYISFIYKKV